MNTGCSKRRFASFRKTYAIERAKIDLPMLPIFALFNPALGMTTVVAGNRSQPTRSG